MRIRTHIHTCLHTYADIIKKEKGEGMDSEKRTRLNFEFRNKVKEKEVIENVLIYTDFPNICFCAIYLDNLSMRGEIK